MIKEASNPKKTLVKFDSWGKSIGLTSSPSDSESVCNEASSISLRDSRQQNSHKSVRFSSVRIREYNAVEELALVDNGEDGSTCRRSLGWDYTEKESNLETHMKEILKERKEKPLNILLDHIHRLEHEKAKQEENKQSAKRKRLRSKVMRRMWKGFFDATCSSYVVMPNPYG